MKSRKFLLMVGVTAVSTALLWFGKITEQTWMMAMSPTVIAYLAANVLQKKILPDG